MRKTFYSSLLFVGMISLFVRLHSAEVEVGEVNWGRDLNASLKSSGESGRPVLIFFQEVPG